MLPVSEVQERGLLEAGVALRQQARQRGGPAPDGAATAAHPEVAFVAARNSDATERSMSSLSTQSDGAASGSSGRCAQFAAHFSYDDDQHDDTTEEVRVPMTLDDARGGVVLSRGPRRCKYPGRPEYRTCPGNGTKDCCWVQNFRKRPWVEGWACGCDSIGVLSIGTTGDLFWSRQKQKRKEI